jgi:cellulose biosynthesis protein BcsS
MAYRCPWSALLGLTALAVAIAELACPVQADTLEQPAQIPPQPQLETPHLEMWAGGQGFAAEWSAYSGASWAPFGSVCEDGLRLRAVLGSGAYAGGRLAFADVLIGYHKQLGPVTLKLFGGLTVADYFPTEPTSMLEGTALGPKALVETWWTVTDRTWVSLDFAFALPHLHLAHIDMADEVDPYRIDYTGRIRLGWRLWPELSVGVEGGAGGPLAPTLQTTWQTGAAHAGGFLRYEWATGEVSVSGGVSLGGDEREGHAHPFGTVSVLTRF